MLSPLLKDAVLKVTKALPTGAASTTSTSIDTGTTTKGTQPRDVELLLTAPAQALALLPNTKSTTYDIIASANADLSSPTILFPGVIVQTGATGTDPAPSATFRTRLPSNCPRYVGCKATGVATSDGSTLSMTLEMLF
jgi:hypothetical protein